VGTTASLARVTDTTEVGPRGALGGKLPSYSLAAAVVLAALAVLAVVFLGDGGDSHANVAKGAGARASTRHAGVSTPPHGSAGVQGTAAAPQGPPSGAVGRTGGRRANVSEVADPEEANSFPAPASVRHKAAAAPSTASEQIVAVGAPSDAEVKHELAQMQAVERSAKEAQKQRLAPVTGGSSVGGNGTIPIPTNVPEVVQRVVAGANAITDFPYVFGGGHASFVDNAYDCSGSVSYALAAGGLLSAPETSGELESWGAPGPGRYITVYAAAGHTYMYVNGVLYNTSGRSGVYASRWQVRSTDNTGYVARHWPGL
jgi:cell wall-associated NlpC family hydrolase